MCNFGLLKKTHIKKVHIFLFSFGAVIDLNKGYASDAMLPFIVNTFTDKSLNISINTTTVLTVLLKVQIMPTAFTFTTLVYKLMTKGKHPLQQEQSNSLANEF